MFLITDSHITNEKFLVYINDLLASGEIADLYTEDDKMNIINNIRPKVKADGRTDTPDECWSWYIEKVCQNLHVALCFSPVGEAFRRRAKRFPALVTCTVIDWFHAWPEDALKNVAANFLSEVDLGEDSVREAVVDFMPYSFTTVNKAGIRCYKQERRHVYTTPKSFLELIKLFTNMLGQKKDVLEKNKEMYESGLVKLEETESVVGKLEEDLKIMSVEVEKKKEEADKVATIVGKEKTIVEAENDKAMVEEEAVNKIKASATEIKTSCEADVARLVPLVETAKTKVQNLSIKDLQFLKGLQTPPADIDKVFFCIMYMMAGVPGYDSDIDLTPQKLPKNLDWKSGCLKLLTNPGKLISLLLKFPEEINNNKVPKQNFAKIYPYFETCEAFKDPVLMGKKSAAAAGVLEFIECMVSYYDAMTQMIPKRQALQQATDELEAATIKLNKVQAEVAELQASLAILMEEFAKAEKDKNDAIAESDRCTLKLNLAQRLVNALGSEKDRWGGSIERLGKEIDVIVGDVLLAAAFISYTGPFSKGLRTFIMNEEFNIWVAKRKIPMSDGKLAVDFLSDDAVRASWNNDGLPSDIVSIENGTILTSSERYPLMVDPQLQGITWIREKEKSRNLIAMRIGSKNYINKIERCLDDGTPVLLENLDDSIDPIVMPIVARNTFKRAGKKYMKFGGKDILLNDSFKLYLQTKLSNPHYPPEVQAEAALINFTVTENGLSDQLLALIVEKERPDLASKKIQLIQQQNQFKIKLKELEIGLLEKLNNSQGDILEDIELIENLEYSKKLSIEIEEKVIIAKETEKMINTSSEFYRASAIRGALIFFLMNELYKMASFYMYSLESFVDVICRAISLVQDEQGTLTKSKPKKGDADAEKKEEDNDKKEPEDEAKKDDDEKKEGEGEDGEKKEGEGEDGEKKEGDAEGEEGEEGEKKEDEGDAKPDEEKNIEVEEKKEGDAEAEADEDDGEIQESLTPRT